MLKLLQENIDSNLQGLVVEKEFMNRIPFAQEFKPTTDKWDLTKSKTFYIAEETRSPLLPAIYLTEY